MSPNMAQGFIQDRDQMEQPPSCPRFLGDELEISQEVREQMPPNARVFEEIMDPQFSPDENGELVMQYAFYLGAALGLDVESNEFLLEFAM